MRETRINVKIPRQGEEEREKKLPCRTGEGERKAMTNNYTCTYIDLAHQSRRGERVCA